MNELDVRDASYKTIHMEISRQRRHPIDHCITAIAALTGTKTWFHKRWGTKADSTYAFFGQEQDLQMAEYLFKLIMAAMVSELGAFKTTEDYRSIARAHGKVSATVSFQRGMAVRLAVRLREIKQEQDDALKAHSTSTALVVLKGQLTEEAFKKVGFKLRSTRTNFSIGNPGAFMAGRAAGDKVNLSRPLGQDGAVIKGRLK